MWALSSTIWPESTDPRVLLASHSRHVLFTWRRAKPVLDQKQNPGPGPSCLHHRPEEQQYQPGLHHHCRLSGTVTWLSAALCWWLFHWTQTLHRLNGSDRVYWGVAEPARQGQTWFFCYDSDSAVDQSHRRVEVRDKLTADWLPSRPWSPCGVQKIKRVDHLTI